MLSHTEVMSDGGQEHFNADGKVLHGLCDHVCAVVVPRGVLLDHIELHQPGQEHGLPEGEEDDKLDAEKLRCKSSE